MLGQGGQGREGQEDVRDWPRWNVAESIDFSCFSLLERKLFFSCDLGRVVVA